MRERLSARPKVVFVNTRKKAGGTTVVARHTKHTRTALDPPRSKIKKKRKKKEEKRPTASHSGKNRQQDRKRTQLHTLTAQKIQKVTLLDVLAMLLNTAPRSRRE